MQKGFVFLMLLSLIFTSLTLQAQAPQPVKERFAALYASYSGLEWGKQNDHWVGIFKDTEGLKKAFFETDGAWLETRLFLEIEELPEGVRQFVKSNYQEAEITFCGKVYDKMGEWYRVESEFANKVVLKTIDVTGRLLEEQVISYSVSNEQPIENEN